MQRNTDGETVRFQKEKAYTLKEDKRFKSLSIYLFIPHKHFSPLINYTVPFFPNLIMVLNLHSKHLSPSMTNIEQHNF